MLTAVRLTRRPIALMLLGNATMAAVIVTASSPVRTKLVATYATICGHGANMEVDRVVMDLGEVEAGPVLTACFDVRNTGGRRLLLTRQPSASGCHCLTADDLVTIPPGQRQEVQVRLKTRDMEGPLRLTQSYRTNDKRLPLLELEVLATVHARTVEPTDLQPVPIEPIAMRAE